MTKNKNFKQACLLVLILFISTVVLSAVSFSQETKDKDLEQGIWNYQHENYDEALALLTKAREHDPNSSLAAYYLGITFKKLQNYPAARPHLEDAVRLTPRIKGALIELIDLLYRLDDTEEAAKWIDVAEKEEIRPAQTAFLKGLVLLKDGTDLDKAVASLEDAKEIDDSMAQVVDYHVGIAKLKSEKLDEAKRIFEEIASRDPGSDLGRFACEFVDVIKEREETTRPLKLYAGLFWQYDDNVVLLPEDETIATGISDKGDSRQVYTARADYNMKFNEKLSTKLGYSMYYAKQTDLGFYDTFGNNFSIQPAFYFVKNIAFSFPVTYNHLRVNDKAYLSQVSAGNLTNIKIGEKQMLQAAATYRNHDYLWVPAIEDEGRDGNEAIWSLAYYYFFAKGKGFVSGRYTGNVDDTSGQNWDYFGSRFSLTSLIPVMKKVNITVVGDFFLEKFLNRNTIFDDRRLDAVFQIASLLSIELFKGAELQLQYTYVDNVSNIGVYDYRRNVYSAGVQFKY